ncbi:MAG: hypothetical protein R3B48_08765 [Kofleriaceae bacterium]
MNTWDWDRVERRLDDLKEVPMYRTTVAAMKRVLPGLRAALPDDSPFVSHVSLSFRGARGRGVSLSWNEDDGYKVSLVLEDSSSAERTLVAEERLADAIRAHLALCENYERSPAPAPQRG